MNRRFVAELPIGELASDPGRVLGIGASDATLHYCSPAHGGWGVVRTALLVPESYLLFVCPAACGRHGAIAAIEQGYKDRVGYLCIEESEIVLGGYEEEIERGVAEVLRSVKPRPRALMVCVSCIDDLLATDHDAAFERMEAEHGLPIRLARMNPIQLDGKLPPGQRIQRTMYEFPRPAQIRDRGVLVLGGYVPPGADSELARFLGARGFGPLRHPGLYSAYDEFELVARSAAALVLRPEGTSAAVTVTGRFGIPALNAPIAFTSRAAAERYRLIDSFLAGSCASGADRGPAAARVASPDLERFIRDEAESAAAAATHVAGSLRGSRVAVDSTATASPFDLALALVAAGVNVERVYAEKLPPHEEASFAALARAKPSLVVCNPSHAAAHAGRPPYPLADVAIGFASGYATMARRTVPVAFDEGLYGFEALRMVCAAIEATLAKRETDLERQVREYGLVV